MRHGQRKRQHQRLLSFEPREQRELKRRLLQLSVAPQPCEQAQLVDQLQLADDAVLLLHKGVALRQLGVALLQPSLVLRHQR